MRSIILAALLVLIAPGSALAAGTLSVSITGAGQVAGGGIDCKRVLGAQPDGVCQQTLDGEVTLTATPADGFEFDSWTGACFGSGGPVCALDMSIDRTTTASFRDVQPPAVTLKSPNAGPLAGTVPVTAEVADNGIVERVELAVDGYKVKDTAAPYTFPFFSKLYPDGPAVISATAYDRAGNVTRATADVIVDNTLPSLEVGGPDREAFPPGSTLTWSLGATDAGSGIQATRCSVVEHGEAPALVPCTSATQHSVSGLAEGHYTFTFKAMDGAGNIASHSRSFRIESEATPEVASETTLAAPAEPEFIPPAAPVSALALALATELDEPEPPRIRVALGFRYISGRKYTKLSHFLVRGVPAGATVKVSCPSGCKRKQYAKKVKRFGRVSLKPLLRRKLKVDTEVTVVVSKPGTVAAVKTLTIRPRKAPLVTTKCQPDGAPEPVPC